MREIKRGDVVEVTALSKTCENLDKERVKVGGWYIVAKADSFGVYVLTNWCGGVHSWYLAPDQVRLARSNVVDLSFLDWNDG